MLATLLSIILVVGMSPIGKAPARAYAGSATANKLTVSGTHSHVTVEVDGAEYSAAVSIASGESKTVTLTPAEDYKLAATPYTATPATDKITGSVDAATGVGTYTIAVDSGLYGTGLDLEVADAVEKTYDVAVAPSLNGTVTPDNATAAKDATVTLTITPDAGYELDTLKVESDDSEVADPTPSTGASPTFTMPASDVTVTATFTTEAAPIGDAGYTKDNATAEVISGGAEFFYSSLDNALAKWTPGRTVKLLKDVDATATGVTLDKAYAIDLGGKTLKVAAGVAASGTDNLKITAAASISNGKIAVTGADDGKYGISVAAEGVELDNVAVSGAVQLVNVGSGSLASTGCTYTVTDPAAGLLDDSAIEVGGSANAALTLDGGSITTVYSGELNTSVGMGGIETKTDGTAVLGKTTAPTLRTQQAAITATAGEVSVKGGSYTSTYLQGNGSGQAYTAANGAAVKVAAGEVTVEGDSTSVTGRNYAASMTGAGKLTVKGGELNYSETVAANSPAVLSVSAGTLSVEGGVFKGADNFADDGTNASALTKKVKGGTFKEALLDGTAASPLNYKQVADGYAAVANGDGTYGVAKTMEGANFGTITVAYDGTEQAPELTVTLADGSTVVPSSAYTVRFYTDATCESPSREGLATVKKMASSSQRYYAKVTANGTEGILANTTAVSSGFAVAQVALDDSAVKVELRDANSEASDPWYAPASYHASYTGSAIAPEVKVTVGDDVYYSTDEGSAIQVAATASHANTNPGTPSSVGNAAPSVTVTPASSSLIFSGSVDAAFNIDGTSVDGATVNLAKASTPYNGAKQAPTITSVVVGDETLAEGDFTVVWKNKAGTTADASASGTADKDFKDADTYTATLTPTGAGYTGTATVEYEISPLDISAATATLAASAATWDGTPIATDWASTSATGLIKTAAIKVGDNEGVSILNGDTTSGMAGKNYTVSPATITGAGTYTIKLVGNGNFTGEKSVGTYKVNPGTFKLMTLETFSQNYDGEKHEPEVDPDGFGKDSAKDLSTINLYEGTDYTIAYYAKTGTDSKGASTYDASKPVEPIAAGDYVAVATGINSWDGSKAQADFTIGTASISGFHDSTTYADMTFTGKALKVADYISDVKLVEKYGTREAVEHAYAAGEWSVYPAEVTNAGNVNLTLTVNGDYAGSVTKKTAVKQAALADIATASDVANSTYDAKSKTEAAAVTVTNKNTSADLVEGVDYTVTYVKGVETDEGVSYDESDGAEAVAAADLKNAGHFQAIIKGAGNYGAEETAGGGDPNIYKYFEIAPAQLSSVTGIAASTFTFAASFTGKPHQPTATISGSAAIKLGDVNVTSEFTQYDETLGTGAFKATEVNDTGTYDNIQLTGVNNYQGTLEAPKYSVTVAAADVAASAEIQFQLGDTGIWAVGGASAVSTAKSGTDPVFQVKVGDAVLSPATDYEATVTVDGLGADKGTVTIVPRDGGRLTGTSATAKFNVANEALSGALTLAEAGPVDYKAAEYTFGAKNSSAGIPSYITLGDGTELSYGSDYTIAVYDANGKITGDTTGVTGAGTYTLVATSVKYAGASKATFTVNKLKLGDAYGLDSNAKVVDDLGNAAVALDKAVYTGGKYTLDTTAVASGKLLLFTEAGGNVYDLEEGDLDITYGANTNAGEATVTLKPASDAQGNYEGAYTETFAIEQADFDDYYSVLTTDIYDANEGTTNSAIDYQYLTSRDFSGVQILPNVEVVEYKGGTTKYDASDMKDGTVTADKVLAEGEYTIVPGENLNAGSGTMVAVPKEGGNFKGSATFNFTIVPVAFDEDHVTVEGLDDVAYTGQAQRPVTVKIKNGDYKLVENTDYIIGYEDNTNAGTATATMVGKGSGSNFTSHSIAKTFKITKADFAGAAVALESASFTYDGTAKTPVVKSVSLGGNELAASDYAVSAAPQTDAGDYVVNVNATSENFEGTATAKWSIARAAQPIAAPQAAEVDFGKSITLAAPAAHGAVTFSSSAPAVAGVDASTGAVTGLSVGTATITATAAGDANWAPGVVATWNVTVKAIPTADKQANPAKVTVAKGKTKKKAAKVKAKKKAAIKGAITVSGAQGTVKVANKSTNKVAKKLKLTYSGGKVKVTVPKGKVKKGKTYAVKAKITASETDGYKSFSKTVTFYVKGK